MTTTTKKVLLSLLAGIYLLGCEVAVIQMASSWYSTAAETAVNTFRSGPAKSVPQLSFPQRRMYVPLVGVVNFVSPTINTTTEYGCDLVWLYRIGTGIVSLPSETFLLYASDPSPPFLSA